MTNAELIAKIKAEIERRINELSEAETNFREEGCDSISAFLISGISELQKILSFISTLESEKTISPWKKIHTYTDEIHKGDIEKMLLELSVGKGEKRTKIALPDRIIDILESEKPMEQEEDLEKEINRFREIFRNECDARIVGEIANHFSQWGAEHLADVCKTSSNDLEEAANNYASITDPEAHGIDFMREVFIAGAEWAMEQKQKWSKEDEEILHKIKQCVYNNVVNIGTVNKVKYIDWLESLRQ